MNSLPSWLTNGLLLLYNMEMTRVLFIVSGIIPVAVQTIMYSQLSLIQQSVLQKINLLSCGLEPQIIIPCSLSYPPISIDGVELAVTKSQKYLELTVDCSLPWTHHVANVSYCDQIWENVHSAHIQF